MYTLSTLARTETAIRSALEDWARAVSCGTELSITQEGLSDGVPPDIVLPRPAAVAGAAGAAGGDGTACGDAVMRAPRRSPNVRCRSPRPPRSGGCRPSRAFGGL